MRPVQPQRISREYALAAWTPTSDHIGTYTNATGWHWSAAWIPTSDHVGTYTIATGWHWSVETLMRFEGDEQVRNPEHDDVKWVIAEQTTVYLETDSPLSPLKEDQ